MRSPVWSMRDETIGHTILPCGWSPPPCQPIVPCCPSEFATAAIQPSSSAAHSFHGGKPVWELGLGAGNMVRLTRGPHGYYATKVMWVVGPNYAHLVTLSAHAVQGYPQLWFDVFTPNGGTGAAQDIYGTHAVLDPGAPNRGGTDNSTGHWNISGIGLFALSAGSYDLTAARDGGSWHTILAVGS